MPKLYIDKIICNLLFIYLTLYLSFYNFISVLVPPYPSFWQFIWTVMILSYTSVRPSVHPFIRPSFFFCLSPSLSLRVSLPLHVSGFLWDSAKIRRALARAREAHGASRRYVRTSGEARPVCTLGARTRTRAFHAWRNQFPVFFRVFFSSLFFSSPKTFPLLIRAPD